MPPHFTKSTVEASAWCPTCYKMTQHRVFGGRLASCMNEHSHPAPEAKPKETQLGLFKNR